MATKTHDIEVRLRNALRNRDVLGVYEAVENLSGPSAVYFMLHAMRVTRKPVAIALELLTEGSQGILPRYKRSRRRR